MKITFFLYLFFLLLFSCVSSDKSVNRRSSNAQGTVIKVNNPTCYNVYFDQDQKVSQNSSGTVTLYIESGQRSRGFDIWYELPLTGTVPIFCKGDHRTIRENQTSLTIIEPQITENYGTFLVIHNKADSAIVFYTGDKFNQPVEQRGSPVRGNSLVEMPDRSEFSPDEAAVFDISGDSGLESYTIREGRKTTPLALPQPLQKNQVYAFEYNTDGIKLTDARPLHRVGESFRPKTINEATGPMPLVAINGEIHMFASTDKNIVRTAYDSAGNAKTPVASGEGFFVTHASAAARDGFFVAGFNGNVPVARIQGESGQAWSILPPREFYSARFYAAARKDGSTWLVAGGGGVRAEFGLTAYARLVRDTGAELAADWELGGAGFDAKISPAWSGVKCGEIMSAAYDSGRDRWLVTGENLEFDSLRRPVKGSYIAVINGAGLIQKVDASFKGLSFYHLLADPAGNYYAAGEGQRGNETRAVVIKFNAEGKELWRTSEGQPAPYSHYKAAVLDLANGQIVLGGVMEAGDGYGTGGVPFVEGVDIENHGLLWREKLNNAETAGAGVVTAIVPAPDYGFALALSGLSLESNAQPQRFNRACRPYIIARVNARGKL
jgi:hypothetical protein